MFLNGSCNEVSDDVIIGQVLRGIPLVVDWGGKGTVVQQVAAEWEGFVIMTSS